MTTTSVLTTFTVTPFTRRSPECPQKENPQWKRCKCRKSIYIYGGGKVSYKSARTRSWEQAECVVQPERDARDPLKNVLAKIEAKKAATVSKPEDVLDQWIAGLKAKGPTHKS